VHHQFRRQIRSHQKDGAEVVFMGDGDPGGDGDGAADVGVDHASTVKLYILINICILANVRFLYLQPASSRRQRLGRRPKGPKATNNPNISPIEMCVVMI